jgi:hypothetical protein
MNCFEFRRLLLADPRHQTREQEAHRADCAACAALVEEVQRFDAAIHQAASVRVPEGLAEKVLLRRKVRSSARAGAWALAASLAIAVGAGLFYWTQGPFVHETVHVHAPGRDHPAVAAIGHVLYEEPRMLEENRGVDPVAMRAAFMRLGLNVPANGTTVLYFDKCPMMGGAGHHVVLQTPFGQVTLILVPDQPFASRVVVEDRNKTAIASPAGSRGYYILIADSRATLERTEKQLL